MKRALILGGGSFGTAVGNVLSENFDQVEIFLRNSQVVSDLKEHKSRKYFGEVLLNKNLIPLEVERLNPKENYELVVIALPTNSIRPFFKEHLKKLEGILEKSKAVVSLSKGMDIETLELPSKILESLFPQYIEKCFYLSGPSFAKELVEKQVTAVSISGENRELLRETAFEFKTPYFQPFLNTDVTGVLLGGALKNVIAIAGGILEGLGFQNNARAALITKGIQEILCIGEKLGAKPETFYGYSGMGDLILTTTSSLSRNKSFGLAIAKSGNVKSVIDNTDKVIEGYKTTKAIYDLNKDWRLSLRIFSGMYEVLYNYKDPREVLADAMRQPPKFEN